MMKPGEKIVDVSITEDELKADLLDGRSITVPLAWYPRLLHATAEQRANWKIAGGGYGIHWPDVDEDLTRISMDGNPLTIRRRSPPLSRRI